MVVDDDAMIMRLVAQMLAFEASREPGWYELDVRTRRRELTVRARSGYFSQSRQG